MAHFREYTNKIIINFIIRSKIISINRSESLHKYSVLQGILRAAFDSQFNR